MKSAVYLASNSPRRSELLTQIGVSFSQVKASVEEKIEPGETAVHYVERLALQKAQAGFENSPKDRPVLGADTIVVIDQNILEKPQNESHAKDMMLLLSGRKHQVLTAVALVDHSRSKHILVKTDVTFKQLNEDEISAYWLTGEPLDKAGGYGIQGVGGKFVTSISGSYSAVVGLPLYETDQLIKTFLLKQINAC